MGRARSGRDTTETRTTLRPIVGLTEALPKNHLETIVVEAIIRHRYLRDLAEARQAELTLLAARGELSDVASLVYIRAMIAVHAQQTVLSTLLDVLGYVPEVPSS